MIATQNGSTYVSLDARYKQLVQIRLRVLDEVCWCLLRGDSNERDTLIGGLEPNDLRTLNLTTRLVTPVALAFATLSLLLLLRGSRRGTEETQGT